MTTPFRWGILGTGGIAHKFATGLSVLTDAQLVAVGSRTQEAADKFADEFKAPNRHASYEALANDPEVEAIYIATPHPFHKDNTLLCLNAGKAVLVEKPFAINANEAQQMIDLSRQKRVFLMEAMWSRFLPAIVRTRELIANGTIGEVRILNADFGFRTNFNPKSRLFDLSLGGGALLDVGIYPISLAFLLFGAPKTINAQAHFSDTGADDQNAIVFSYEQGQLALLSSASRTNTAHEAIIYGTDGSIRIPDWWHGQKLILNVNGKPTETFDIPHLGNGYPHEAIEVANCVRAGKIESDTMPLDESLTIIQTMDTIRSQWGLKYPTE